MSIVFHGREKAEVINAVEDRINWLVDWKGDKKIPESTAKQNLAFLRSALQKLKGSHRCKSCKQWVKKGEKA